MARYIVVIACGAWLLLASLNYFDSSDRNLHKLIVLIVTGVIFLASLVTLRYPVRIFKL